MSNQQIQILISARDKASRVIRGISKKLRKLAKTAKKAGRGIGKAFKKVTGALLNLKTSIVAVAGIAGFIGLTKSILKTGGAFEDYRATLKVVLGSQEKANKAFAWLNTFAQTTPFEIDNLTSSFVKLAAYGIDGTKVMKTLGDTAAAMGKDIDEAVEALADAQTGEFERLKQFGMKAIQISKSNAQKMGATMEQVGMTALAFTDKMGKESYEIIDRNNRAMVTSTIQAIWNEKYAGAMEERSKTMNGMLSNLSDAWTNFKAKVADQLLPKVKEGLQGVLDKINEWGDNGVITGWSHFLSVTIGSVIEWLKGLGSSFTEIFEKMGLSFFSYNVDMDKMKEKGKEFGETLIRWFNKIKDFLKTDGKTMWKDIKEGLRSTITVVNHLASALIYVADLFKSLNQWSKDYSKQRAKDKGFLESIGYSTGVMLSNQDKDKSWFGTRYVPPKAKRASGGGISANQSYLVGERGAEVFTPTTSGRISPNAGGSTNITNIYTNATAHGINNALGSRGDNVSRGARVGMNIARATGFNGYGNLSMARAR